MWLQCAERGVFGVFEGALQCEEGKARAAKEGAERCQVLSHCWWRRSAKNAYFQQFLAGLRACLMCMETSFIFSVDVSLLLLRVSFVCFLFLLFLFLKL